jgi:hypothetical protein
MHPPSKHPRAKDHARHCNEPTPAITPTADRVFSREEGAGSAAENAVCMLEGLPMLVAATRLDSRASIIIQHQPSESDRTHRLRPCSCPTQLTPKRTHLLFILVSTTNCISIPRSGPSFFRLTLRRRQKSARQPMEWSRPSPTPQFNTHVKSTTHPTQPADTTYESKSARVKLLRTTGGIHTATSRLRCFREYPRGRRFLRASLESLVLICTDCRMNCRGRLEHSLDPALSFRDDDEACWGWF